MRDCLPNGVLGIAVTGLLAAFMAGMAANVSGFNTVFTYDIWQAYVKQGPARRLLPADRPDRHRRRHASSASAPRSSPPGYSNIMNYIQALFSFFNAPLFATFIIGMFWKRMTPWAGFSSLLTGHPRRRWPSTCCYKAEVVHFNSDLEESFWGAGIAFVTAAVVAVWSPRSPGRSRTRSCAGLVYGIGAVDVGRATCWPATPSGAAPRCCSA